MRRPWRRPTRTGEGRRRASALASIESAPYRRFILSQVLSCLCLWSHRTAHIWLTVVVTDSDPFSVGLVTALQFLPMLLSPVGGVLGDRWHKRSVLLVSQLVAVAGTLVLAVAARADAATMPLLAVMAVVLGLCAAVDAPVRLVFPWEIVEKRLLQSAIGVNGVVYQMARVVGPAVAGVVIARWDEGVGLFFAAACGIGALVALSALRKIAPATSAPGRGRESWRRTLRTVADRPGLTTPLVGAIVVGACLANLQVALPLILDSIPGAGVAAFGLTVAMIGVGGAAGALIAGVTASTPSLRRLDAALVLFGLVALVVAFSPQVPLVAATLFVAGAVMQFYNTNSITLIQRSTPFGREGRVMGLYVVAFFVWSGLGTPAFGLLADRIGPRPALALASGLCAVAGVLMAVRRPVAGTTLSRTHPPSYDGPTLEELP